MINVMNYIERAVSHPKTIEMGEKLILNAVFIHGLDGMKEFVGEIFDVAIFIRKEGRECCFANR